jgi:putative endonuclease
MTSRKVVLRNDEQDGTYFGHPVVWSCSWDSCEPTPDADRDTDAFDRHSRVGGNPARFTVDRQFYVYIMASKRNGTLYIGVTSNLVQRAWQHKEEQIEGFSSKYGVKILVYFEVHETAESAIVREKQIKKWNRAWKLNLIEGSNPEWKDLYETIIA